MILHLFLRGVILMRLEHAGKILSASLISATVEDDEDDGDDDADVRDAAA